jgi:hypothetical protein
MAMIRAMLAQSGGNSENMPGGRMPSMSSSALLEAMQVPSAFSPSVPEPEVPRAPIPLRPPSDMTIPKNEAMTQDQQLQDRGIEQLSKLIAPPREDRESVAKIIERLSASGADRDRLLALQSVPSAGMRVPAPPLTFDMQSYVKGLTGGLETTVSDPNAINPDTGAAGIFQFQPSTVESLKRNDPELAKSIDDNWRRDPVQQQLLLNNYTTISDNMIRQIMGHDPTNPERYTMHMLGHGLGAKVLANLDAPIESFLSSESWADHIKKNPKRLKAGMTGREFLDSVSPAFRGA